MKITRTALIAYGLAVAVILIDQATKAWIMSGLDLREVGRVPVWPPIFNFSWVENRGVSFGLFGDGSARWLLSVFSIVVTGVLAWWATKADRRLLVWAIGLVMGGAVGNVIDRIRFGYVVDFLDFHYGNWHFPAFNVADAAITVGAVCLILDEIQRVRRSK